MSDNMPEDCGECDVCGEPYFSFPLCNCKEKQRQIKRAAEQLKQIVRKEPAND